MRLQRFLYLSSRTVGDIDAAKKGKLTRRLVKRTVHRKEVRVLRRLKLW